MAVRRSAPEKGAEAAVGPYLFRGLPAVCPEPVWNSHRTSF